MSGIPHDHYEPNSGFEKWLHRRLPVAAVLYDTIMIPTPKNLNWMWIWGIVLTFCLALQIITGIVLAMHYTPHVVCAGVSIEHILREVTGGWMLRHAHGLGCLVVALTPRSSPVRCPFLRIGFPSPIPSEPPLCFNTAHSVGWASYRHGCGGCYTMDRHIAADRGCQSFRIDGQTGSTPTIGVDRSDGLRAGWLCKGAPNP